MNDTLINAYQNELVFMKQERNKWKERTKKAVKERNNLQSKIDKAIEWIEQYEKQIGTLGETSKSIVLTDDVVIGNLLDILKGKVN